LSRQRILTLAAACIPAHQAYAPDLLSELTGMADGAGLSLAEMIVVNGFTDFLDTVYNACRQEAQPQPLLTIDDCTAFLVPDQLAAGCGFFGQTWDMHDTALEFVLMLHLEADDEPAVMTFTTSGCIGQIGMNDQGIAVGINNLSGAEGQVGVTWPFVVRKILQQDNIEAALECIVEADLAGAHNYLLFDRLGNGYNVDAMSTNLVVEQLAERPIVHTNHCLEPATLACSQTKLPDSQAHSEARLDFARQQLDTGGSPITVEHLQALTRQFPVCTAPAPRFHAITCGAAIMRPKTAELGAVAGLPTGNQNQHITH
jgi:isopenicillin-N N-acyltransferase-like protein